MIIKLQNIQKWLNSNKIDFISNFDLKEKSWIRAGGLIKTFITPKNIDELKHVIFFLKKNNINFYVLGNISNTLIRDGIILTPIINLKKINSIVEKKVSNFLKLEVGAGTPIPRFANLLIKKGYKGAESLNGIPGTIGGGIFMNASCYEDHLITYVNKIFSINHNGKIITRTKSEARFTWRNSIYQIQNEIIFKVIFTIPLKSSKDQSIIKNKSKQLIYDRKKMQESDKPNLGSLFATKNLYNDIKFVSFSFFILYLINKIFLILIHNQILKKIDIVFFRKKINFFYKKAFSLKENQSFTLSDKTINCLINNGNGPADDAIRLVKKLRLQTKNKIKLENIILENIE